MALLLSLVSMTKYWIYCTLRVPDPDAFAVVIKSDMRVNDLKVAILNKKRQALGDIDPYSIVLWKVSDFFDKCDFANSVKVSMPAAGISQALANFEPEGEQLQPMMALSDVFGAEGGHLHIIAQPPSARACTSLTSLVDFNVSSYQDESVAMVISIQIGESNVA